MLDAAAAAAGRAEPRIVASVPVCVTTKTPTGEGLIAACLAGYNDLPSYRGVMDAEGAGGPADVSIVGSEDEVPRGHRRVRRRRGHRLRAGRVHPRPRRCRRDPGAAQGRRRRRPRLTGPKHEATWSTSWAARSARAGIVEVEPTDRGLALHRLPAWSERSTTTSRSSLLETMPAGVRLELVTDATCVELDVQLTVVQLGASPAPRRASTSSSTASSSTAQSTRGHADHRGPAHRRGRLPARRADDDPLRRPAGRREARRGVAAQRAAVELLELRADGAVRAPDAAARALGALRQLDHPLHGGTRPTGMWPAVAARLAGVDLQNLGVRRPVPARPVRGADDRRAPADAISLKVGINVVNGDTMRERTFVPARARLPRHDPRRPPRPRSRVITPIICPVAEDHPGRRCRRRRAVHVVRAARALARARSPPAHPRAEPESSRAAGRRRPEPPPARRARLFGPDDVGDLPDGLHPNPAGYQRMGERFHALAFQGDGPFAGCNRRHPAGGNRQNPP